MAELFPFLVAAQQPVCVGANVERSPIGAVRSVARVLGLAIVASAVEDVRVIPGQDLFDIAHVPSKSSWAR